MNFSLEIGPKTDLETLPPVKDVYVTMLPGGDYKDCLLYTSPRPRDGLLSRMPSSA